MKKILRPQVILSIIAGMAIMMAYQNCAEQYDSGNTSASSTAENLDGLPVVSQDLDEAAANNATNFADPAVLKGEIDPPAEESFYANRIGGKGGTSSTLLCPADSQINRIKVWSQGREIRGIAAECSSGEFKMFGERLGKEEGLEVGKQRYLRSIASRYGVFRGISGFEGYTILWNLQVEFIKKSSGESAYSGLLGDKTYKRKITKLNDIKGGKSKCTDDAKPVVKGIEVKKGARLDSLRVICGALPENLPTPEPGKNLFGFTFDRNDIPKNAKVSLTKEGRLDSPKLKGTRVIMSHKADGQPLQRLVIGLHDQATQQDINFMKRVFNEIDSIEQMKFECNMPIKTKINQNNENDGYNLRITLGDPNCHTYEITKKGAKLEAM